MTTSWYIARNKQRFGPFSTSQLQQLAVLGLVQPTEYVLPAGSMRWVPATAVEGLVPNAQHSYWLSVGGKVQGPFCRELLRAALRRRHLSGDTPACPQGGSCWLPLAQLAEFRDCVPGPARDSRAHLGLGSNRLDLSVAEAELHLEGKAGDPIARLISTLLDMSRHFADNPSMRQVLEQNIHDLKAMRERPASCGAR
jgi:hypothetical protein